MLRRSGEIPFGSGKFIVDGAAKNTNNLKNMFQQREKSLPTRDFLAADANGLFFLQSVGASRDSLMTLQNQLFRWAQTNQLLKMEDNTHCQFVSGDNLAQPLD